MDKFMKSAFELGRIGGCLLHFVYFVEQFRKHRAARNFARKFDTQGGKKRIVGGAAFIWELGIHSVTPLSLDDQAAVKNSIIVVLKQKKGQCIGRRQSDRRPTESASFCNLNICLGCNLKFVMALTGRIGPLRQRLLHHNGVDRAA